MIDDPEISKVIRLLNSESGKHIFVILAKFV